MNEKDDPRSFGEQPYRASENTTLPPWMQGDKISVWEKTEITFYKFVTYIPVAITFGVFGFLFTFYTAVSTVFSDSNFQVFLYPSFKGDFYGIIGLPDMYKNQQEMDEEMLSAKIYGILFAIFSMNLLISIIATIRTPPGSIPDDSEWDMPS